MHTLGAGRAQTAGEVGPAWLLASHCADAWGGRPPKEVRSQAPQCQAGIRTGVVRGCWLGQKRETLLLIRHCEWLPACRAARTLLYYLTETNLTLHNWLFM